MRISDIKYKAEEILNMNKKPLLKVFIFIAVVIGGITYVRGEISNSILVLTIMLATLPLSHGYITTSLKAVNNRHEEIDMQKDGLSGIYRFTDLFGTYFIKNFFLGIITVVFLLIGFIVLRGMISSSTIREIASLITYGGDAFFNARISATASSEVTGAFGFFFLLVIIACVFVIFYEATFALTPYLLEKHGIKGVEAMKKSMQLMKGYKKTYVLLNVSFIGWMLLVGVIETIFITMGLHELLILIIGILLTQYIYGMKLHISLAVLFEEIELANRGSVTDVENEVLM